MSLVSLCTANVALSGPLYTYWFQLDQRVTIHTEVLTDLVNIFDGIETGRTFHIDMRVIFS